MPRPASGADQSAITPSCFPPAKRTVHGGAYVVRCPGETCETYSIGFAPEGYDEMETPARRGISAATTNTTSPEISREHRHRPASRPAIRQLDRSALKLLRPTRRWLHPDLAGDGAETARRQFCYATSDSAYQSVRTVARFAEPLCGDDSLLRIPPARQATGCPPSAIPMPDRLQSSTFIRLDPAQVERCLRRRRSRRTLRTCDRPGMPARMRHSIVAAGLRLALHAGRAIPEGPGDGHGRH